MERYQPNEHFEITDEGSEAALSELWQTVEKEPDLTFVSEILAHFPGSRVALVGGIVRDGLLGLPCKDYDLVVEGIPSEENKTPITVLSDFLVSSGLGQAYQARSRAYAVIKFTPTGSKEQMDIALPRTEKYEPGMMAKHAEVETDGVTLEEDFSRRDYTINALGMDMKTGELIDPYGGVEDLKNGVVRAVGDPTQRFNEDPSRIPRGLRFAAKFGFDIDPATEQAMKEQSGQILETFELNGETKTRVAWQTIGKEFASSMKQDPATTIELYDRVGLLEKILPEVAKLKGCEQSPSYHSEGDAYVHTMLVMKNLEKLSLEPEIEEIVPTVPLSVKLAACFHDLGKPDTVFRDERGLHFYEHENLSTTITQQICSRLELHMEKDLSETISWLVENHMRMHKFGEMRPEKQKQLARDPRFPSLLLLSYADASSSLRPDGSVDVDYVEGALAKIHEVREEAAEGKPTVIIAGNEIIDIIKTTLPAFDSKRQGRLIGKIKNEINDLYDSGAISTKEEAIALARKLVKKEL
jgi:poly(A) polymerase